MTLAHPIRTMFTALAPLLLAGALAQTSALAESAFKIPAPAADVSTPGDGLQTAVLAGGCFWGVQAVFQHTTGVTTAVSGYSGGTKATANYNLVSAGRSAHAEAVEIKFDPKKISYGKILQIFFSVAHDPTQLDRQGPDSGPQYRSAIFYANAEQQKVAQAYIAQLNTSGAYKSKIVTRVDNLDAFYPAEDYHQDYAFLHPMQPYIYINDRPKVENLKRMFADIYRDKPALVKSAGN